VGVPAASPAEVWRGAGRFPLLVLFLGAAAWLTASWVFALIASIKFHSPAFLAQPEWLTYGRVKPVATNAFIYGFCLPAGLGLALWLTAWLGRAKLAAPVAVLFGGVLWNLGVAVGVLGILAGDITGFEHLDFPFYSAVILFLGYLLLGAAGVLTLHRRTVPRLFVSQWFLVAAIFWFPWIYSTANLLLLVFPVRGVAQAIVNYWYSANLLVVWFGLVGLAAAFYLVPKVTQRELNSHYLGLFVFWVLILFGSWTGIPATAPVPAWMPTLSTVATVLTGLLLPAVALILHNTLDGHYSLLWKDPALRFVGFGLGAFLLAGSMHIVEALAGGSRMIHFTWFSVATAYLNTYGFFTMVVFGSLYYLLPRLANAELPFPVLARAHFWLAAIGVALVAAPLAVGGIIQARNLVNPDVAFVDVAKGTLPFLRASTMGDLLILLGNSLLFVNLLVGVGRFYRAQLRTGFGEVTTNIPGEGAKVPGEVARA